MAMSSLVRCFKYPQKSSSYSDAPLLAPALGHPLLLPTVYVKRTVSKTSIEIPSKFGAGFGVVPRVHCTFSAQSTHYTHIVFAKKKYRINLTISENTNWTPATLEKTANATLERTTARRA